MDPYRDSPQTCSSCPKLAVGRCKRCGAALCSSHRHGKRRRCQRCELEFDQRLVALADRPPVIRSRSWKNLPVDLAVLVLFLAALPALLIVDLGLFALVGYVGSELWPFACTRQGYSWLRSKELRLWHRRRHELRQDFLAEKLLGDGDQRPTRR